VVSNTTQEFNILVPVLCAVAILMARAVFIPTTPRRTFVVSVLGALPSVVSTYFLATRLSAGTSIPTAVGEIGYGPTIYVACWAGMAVAPSTVTSRIIYGLEQKVREARQLGQYTLVERIGGFSSQSPYPFAAGDTYKCWDRTRLRALGRQEAGRRRCLRQARPLRRHRAGSAASRLLRRPVQRRSVTLDGSYTCSSQTHPLDLGRERADSCYMPDLQANSSKGCNPAARS